MDWAYADLYLDGATRRLAPICSRERFESLSVARRQVPNLAYALERAIGRADWEGARRLAEEGRTFQASNERNRMLFEVGRAVYAPRSLDSNRVVLALTGALSHPTGQLKRSLSELVRDLRDLEAENGEWAAFYAERAAHFAGLEVVSADDQDAGIDVAVLKEQLREAAERGEFSHALRLLKSMQKHPVDRNGRVRAAIPAPERTRLLAAPIPQDAVQKMEPLGLEMFELGELPEFNAYLSCCCADRVTLPRAPITETNRTPQGCTCGHACPPGIRPSVKMNLDSLLIHPFLTSGGTRYLPWFGRETVLVERFPEGEPGAEEPLLRELELPKRSGLTRLAIENALLRHGPSVLERAGLDPFEFRLVNVPFDVYHRLAPRLGWGERSMWTHFDGYHVISDLSLRALVGGDIKYGGADDLCGVERGYDSARIWARFAVVRRSRFDARPSPV